MTEAQAFAERYRKALVTYAGDPSEAGRAEAYALGREAVHDSVSLLDLAVVHGEAMEHIGRVLQPSAEVRKAANEFYLEALSTFDMTQRGYLEAQERARSEREHAEQLSRLNDAVVAVASVQSHEARLAMILAQSITLLSARRSAVFTGTEEASQPPGTPEELAAARPLARVVRANAGTMVEQSGPVTGGDEEWVLAAPIGEPGQHARGALLVYRSAPFSKDEVAMGEQFARYASMALDMAARLEQEHDTAVTLQNALLPPAPPDVPGLDVAWRYKTADSLDIGGDWYDVFSLESGDAVLVVGDVMGHDLHAAAVMGQLRLALQAYAVEGHSPAEVVDRADRLLQLIHPAGLATLVYAQIDSERRELRLSNAGHPPPLLLEPGGGMVVMTEGLSVPLGTDATGKRHREAVYRLRPGSLLLLYTDGLVEDRAHSIEEGIRRLIEHVREGARSPDELCEQALSARPKVLRDDICVLCAAIG